MKAKFSFKPAMHLIMVLGVAGVIGACSGQQQSQEETLETSQQQEGDASQGTASNEGSVENVTPSETEAAANGADINSATTDDAAQLDATLNGSGASSPVADAGVTPANATAESATTASTASSSAAASSTAGGPQAPVAGGRVRYVKEGGVQVVNAPGGSPVFTLEQGDHPVTWEENGWLRLNTGMYVPADALSDQGIGRPGNGQSWMAH